MSVSPVYRWPKRRRPASNPIEGAFAYAVTQAHDFVLNAYNEIMDPVMTDQFDGDWAF